MIDGAFVLDVLLTGLFLAQFALILWNRRIMQHPEPRRWGDDAPLVSVLVPARNEEATIGSCLSRLLGQDYPNLEIVVVDDNSIDRTAEIVRSFDDPRVRLRKGTPLRSGWSGKNWACHQLASAATGDVFCFVDADTTLEREAVSTAMEILTEEQAGLVSLLPRSGSKSLTGKVLLPMVTHGLIGLFPISLVHHRRNPKIAIAAGPFMMISREAYDASGGHAAAPDHVVDDVQLARNVKAAGFSVRLANGTDLVETRWYDDLGDIWRGFSKNAFGAMDNSAWMGFAVLFLLIPALLVPFVRLGFGMAGDGISDVVVFQCLLLLANRALTSTLGGDPVWTTPFHPITVAFWGMVVANSMLLYATNSTVAWKDRHTPIR